MTKTRQKYPHLIMELA